MEKEKNPSKGAASVGSGEPKAADAKIDIFRAWCKACGICAAFCPTKVLARDEGGYPYVQDLEKCIKCGLCEIRCPDFAITVETISKGKRRAREKREETTEGIADSGQ